MSRYFKFLKNVYFFSSLSDDDIANIESVCLEKKFDDGAVIFQEGSLGDSFFIILEGTVEIWKHYGELEQDLLTVCGPGQSFGELAIIDDSPRSATVVAREKVRLLSISNDSFKRVISGSNPISLSIMKSITSMIRRSNETFIENMKAKNHHLERAYAQLKKESKERRRAEEELRESSRRMCSILDSMPDMILELDKDMRIRWANKAALERNPEAVDQFCYEAYWKGTHICEGCPSAMALDTGKIELAAVYQPVSTSTPEETYWENIGIPLKDSRGEITGVLEVSRNITHRMKLEEELRRAQKMKAIGTLAGGVAHEFNNLLMCIQGNVSLMLANADETDPKYHRLKNIEQHVQYGADLTKKLLGIASRKKFRIEKTDMNDILRKIAESFENAKKNVRIREKYAPNLWNVEAEPQQISQVLSDILQNAWQAMPGGGDLRLETENVILNASDCRKAGLKNGRYVKICVADNGIGMEPSIRQQIFDPFFTTKSIGNGNGLSLSSAYSIIDDHGGSIYVYSEKGKGSIFEILLPCAEK
jgi:signal transduction histidine kinase/CRP-like cAMP-binding protein